MSAAMAYALPAPAPSHRFVGDICHRSQPLRTGLQQFHSLGRGPLLSAPLGRGLRTMRARAAKQPTSEQTAEVDPPSHVTLATTPHICMHARVARVRRVGKERQYGACLSNQLC